MEASTPSPETREGASEPLSAPEGTSTGTGQTPEPGEPEGERDESGRDLNREAAGYRRRLRETEAERNQLRAQLDELQRAEVERLAGAAGLSAPSDVWTFGGASLDTLRGETGAIDADTVAGVVQAILKDRPGLARPAYGDLGIGRGGSAIDNSTRGVKVGLSQLLKPGR